MTKWIIVLVAIMALAFTSPAMAKDGRRDRGHRYDREGKTQLRQHRSNDLGRRGCKDRYQWHRPDFSYRPAFNRERVRIVIILPDNRGYMVIRDSHRRRHMPHSRHMGNRRHGERSSSSSRWHRKW